MAILSFENFVNKAGGKPEDVILSSSISKTEIPTEQPDFLSRLGTEFKRGGETIVKGVERGAELIKEDKPIQGALATGLGAAGGAIETVLSPVTAAISPFIEKGLKASGITDNQKVQETLSNLDTWAKEHPDAAENLKNAINIAGTLTGTKAITTAVPTVTKGIETVTTKGLNLADDAFKAGLDLKKNTQVMLASKNVSPQLETSAERLFLQGTKRLENPVSTYDKFLEQTKKSLVDIKQDPAIAEVGGRMSNAFNTVVKQRRAVGAKMGEELKKVGGIKTDITEAYTSLETLLEEAGVRYNGITKKIIPTATSKMTQEDMSLLSQYIKELNKLGDKPTIAEIDATIARSQGLVNNFKSAKGIVETTNAERLIKGSLSKLREQFDPVKTGNKALAQYSNARKTYSELSDFIDDGAGYLGKITQSGDFAKDASIAKSAVQSVLNNGKKDWMIRLEALTGYPAIDESVLALQAMKDAGDFRGLSLLQAMSEGGVPTSKAGFTQAVLDYAISKGTRIVAGTPEQQTRAFLNALAKKASQKTLK